MVTIKLTLPVQVAVIEADGLVATEDKIAFGRLEECATEYRRSCAEQGIGSPGGVEGVQVARSFFRAIGIDPTKTRPSSEALLRRALKEKPLHAVNTLVDLCNWCSL